MRSLLKWPCWLVLCVLMTSGWAGAQGVKTERLPDGTGTIGLPTGWRIANSYRGSVDCTGPNGGIVRLGLPWAITTPTDPVTGMPTIASGQAPTANTGDVLTALNQVMMIHGRARITRLARRPAPAAIPGMPAWFINYDFQADGKSFTAVGYFTTLAYGNTSPVWSLYSSAVVAPKAMFWKSFPTMVNIWKSWRPNGKEPDAGSASALVDGLIKKSWASAEKNHLYFREYVLGKPGG